MEASHFHGMFRGYFYDIRLLVTQMGQTLEEYNEV
jgi:hypothetical protein